MAELTLPRAPDDWFEAGRRVFEEFIADLGRHGVTCDPDLRLTRDDASPTPYYEPATKTIGFGMPDPSTISGRMHFVLVARVLGFDSVDAAIEALAIQIPLLVAHETTHHLRHYYGAPIDNDFVEEEVVNVVALAWLAEHPRHRATIEAVKRQAEDARARLAVLSPDTPRYAAAHSLDLGDVLLGLGKVDQERAEELRRLATRAGESLATVLVVAGAVSQADVDAAARAQSEAETYFNDRYMQNLVEYGFFATEWLRAYLDRSEFPSFDEALRAHILTADWDRARRDETRAMLSTVLNHPSEDLAAVAAHALAEEAGSDAVEPLLAAGSSARPAVRRAALMALASLGVHDDRLVELGRRAIGTERAPGLRAAAAQLALALGVEVEPARAMLTALLDGGPDERRAALEAVAEGLDSELEPLVVAALADRSSSVRALAARALRGRPAGDALDAVLARALVADADHVRVQAARSLAGQLGPAGAAALAVALADDAAAVREAARDALLERGPAALGALREAATDSNPALRAEAAMLRAQLHDPDAHAEIKRVLGDVLGRVRRLAAARSAVAASGSDDGTQLLATGVAQEERRLGELVLRLAGQLGNPATMALALQGLSAEDADLRATARDLAVAAVPAALRGDVAAMLAGGDGSATMNGDEALRALAQDGDGLIAELASEAGAGFSARTTETTMLTTTERLMLLRAVPVLATVELVDLRRLAGEVTIERHGAGEEIFRAGADADAAYVIVAGRVALERIDESGGRRRVAELAPRQVLGEIALITGEPHAETAATTRDATLLRLDRETFLRTSSREPRVLVEVIRVLSERLRAATLGTGAPASPAVPSAAERGLSVVWSGSGLHRGLVELRGLEADEGSEA